MIVRFFLLLISAQWWTCSMTLENHLIISEGSPSSPRKLIIDYTIKLSDNVTIIYWEYSIMNISKTSFLRNLVSFKVNYQTLINHAHLFWLQMRILNVFLLSEVIPLEYLEWGNGTKLCFELGNCIKLILERLEINVLLHRMHSTCEGLI